MAWTDEQLKLLAHATYGSPHVDAENFSTVVSLWRKSLVTVRDGDEGSIEANATERGITLALQLKIIIPAPEDEPWRGYQLGPKHP